MALEIINVGASPNDGTGDPLRTAYIKCNNNFALVNSRAQSNPPTTLLGAPGDTAGMYAYDSTYFYYCFADYTGNSNIWAQVTQVGNLAVSQIDNGTSTVAISGPNGPATISINDTSNVAIFSTSGANITGTLDVTSTVTGGNLQTAGLINATGTITGGNLRTSGTVSATGTITGGNLRTSGSISTVGGITSDGTITASFFVGDGSGLTNLPGGGGGGGSGTSIANGFSSITIPVSSGNIHVDVGLFSDLAIFTQLGITVNGTLTATNLAGILTTASQPNITEIGTLAGLTATGNIVSGNITTSGKISATDSISTSGAVSAVGNVTAQYFIGDGSLLTNVGNVGSTYGDANVAAYLPTYTGNLNGNNLSITNTANVGGNLNITGTTNASGPVNANVVGQLTGPVDGINMLYGMWDFGNIDGNTFSNPIAWIFSTTAAGNIDMGNITAPSSYNFDIGTIY